MEDIIITCACGAEREWTVEQQKQFAEKAWPAPKRCRDCAAKKRAQLAASPKE